MKAILEFDLADQEDVELHQLSLKARDYSNVLIKVHNSLRSAEKYGTEPLSYKEFTDILHLLNIDLFE